MEFTLRSFERKSVICLSRDLLILQTTSPAKAWTLAFGGQIYEGQRKVIRSLSLILVLTTFWLLFSGHYDARMLAMGALSVALTTWIVRRTRVLDDEGHSIPLAISSFAYFPWLMWEIIKSNFEVASLILSPSRRVKPSVFSVTSTQNSDVFRVIYANSITLTPGTLTISVNDDEFEVHAIADGFREELRTNRMDRRVSRMAGRT
jgi:multicomponent Na+:H+ antiporter subunit E